uniref:Aminopeptidase n=1 Tax=Callorhinchus milii TaxID=7868 RepID=A0A4W3JV94_CALMI
MERFIHQYSNSELSCSCFLYFYAPIASNGQKFPWNKMRLPNRIIPLHYDLLIHPNLTTLSFTGVAKIEVSVKQDTNSIVLHSKYLEITSATIALTQDGIAQHEKAMNVLEFPPYEQIALQSIEPLGAGEKYVININYAANLSDGFYGFYKSSYKTQDGKTRLLASTHFEPTSARMAFPCFDEPSFKANFSVKIRRGSQYIALSNMPMVKSFPIGEGIFEDHFAVSVRMSTYLVAFIVCDFKSVSAVTSTGIKVSIYAVPDKWSQTHYALEAAVKLLEFYEHYFNIYFPLPKQDLVAIPDFESGAMENWGLITYRETSLLYDSVTSSASNKLWITMVIGHELAHQWFGNLVTMEWWNDIWLNEGFARYMEFVSVGATYPELQVDDYLLNTCFGAMGSDSMNSSRAISTAAESPTQIQEMFDSVSYEKGACILHMLRNFLTEEVFQSGLVSYLRKYSYGNAKNEDLWNSMANTCTEGNFTSGGFCYSTSQAAKNAYLYTEEHLDIKEVMNTWTLQKGLPVIIVEHSGSLIRLRQERFLKSVLPEDPVWESLQSGYLWHIPLTYITSNSDRIGRYLLKTKSDTIKLDKEADWVKFNVDMNGYYIVHYEHSGWDALVNLLDQDHTLLSMKDRTHLIHNAFQLVSAGKLSLDRALDLTRYLRHENKTMPVLQGLAYLEVFYKLVEKRNIPDVATNLKRYILEFFKHLIDKQSWSDDGSLSERLLRTNLLEMACDLQYPPCLQKALDLFNKWKNSNGTISLPTDVLEIVHSVGAQSADGWEYLLKKYIQSMSGAEKIKILNALAATRDPEKLSGLLEIGMEGNVIKLQDLDHVVAAVSRNPVGHLLAWNFVKRNWNKLIEKFELGSFTIRWLIVGTTSHFSSKEELEEVKMFFESIKEQSSQLRCTQLALETIQKNIRWLERNLDVLRSWLLDITIPQ